MTVFDLQKLTPVWLTKKHGRSFQKIHYTQVMLLRNKSTKSCVRHRPCDRQALIITDTLPGWQLNSKLSIRKLSLSVFNTKKLKTAAQ